jgi:hypothetical protein
VIRLTIEAARSFFDENPNHNTFSVCVNDNPRYCECDACSALDKPYRDIAVGRRYSESYFSYASKVAGAVAITHPDRYLGAYAYWNVEQPPRDRQRLPNNVIVALTQDILQHYDAAYRDKDRALLRAWAGRVDRLHTYVYYGLGWYTPRMSPRLVAEDLRFAAQNRVRAIYCESYPFWAWCGPMHYVASRLQWDVNTDMDEVLAELHEHCFGEVAPQMKAFHAACERYWTRARPGRWFEGLDNLAPEEAMADIDLLREAQRYLEQAVTMAEDPTVRQRLGWLKRGFDFTMAVAGAFEVHRDAREAPDRLEQLIRAADRVENSHALVAELPAYSHTYYKLGPRFDRKCWRWFKDPVLDAAEARRMRMQKDPGMEDVSAEWPNFARHIGLTKFLKRRGWE